MNRDLNLYDITPYEKAELEDILENGVKYIDSHIFTGPKPYKVLFKDVAEVPDPETNWFLRVIHGGDTKARTKKTKVLSKDQEKFLFLQYNWIKHRISGLLKEDRIDISMIIHYLRQKNRLREKIVGYNLALVLNIVKKTAAKNVSFDDLTGIGNEILLKALDRFDVATGNKFSTYLTISIPRALGKESQKTSRYHDKFPVTLDTTASKDEHLGEWAVAKDEVPEEEDSVAVMVRVIDENLADLDDKELKVIKARYPMDHHNNHKRQTLSSLGKEMGTSKANLSRLEKLAIIKLRRKLIEIIGDEPGV